MPSSPPRHHPSSSPPRLASAEAFVLEEGVIFFSVEGAPAQACRTETDPDGSLTFTTTLRGRVVEVGRDELTIEQQGHPTRIRYLLPEVIDLSALHARTLLITVHQGYAGRGRATIDAEIRDEAGRLLLWARDGRLPSDRDARGLALRLCVGVEGDPRLAVSSEGGVVTIAAPGYASVQRDGVACDLLLVRLEPDDASFVLVRRD